jgi:hypothetical protein
MLYDVMDEAFLERRGLHCIFLSFGNRPTQESNRGGWSNPAYKVSGI